MCGWLKIAEIKKKLNKFQRSQKMKMFKVVPEQRMDQGC